MAPSRAARVERAVLPHGLAAADQPAPDEVARGEVVVAGDRDQRPPEPPRHVLDEARLAASGRALEHDGEPARVALPRRRATSSPTGR